MSNVNEILEQMRSVGKQGDYKEKGNLGEKACNAVLENAAKKLRGALVSSFKYNPPRARNGDLHPGNLMYEGPGPLSNSTVTLTSAHIDEIDHLLITPYRIFCIETKSYGNSKLEVREDWFYKNGSKYEKELAVQTEKHGRLFYHTFYDLLPDGDPTIICNILCSVDKSTISAPYPYDIVVCSLNTLNETILKHNKKRDYSIDIPAILQRIKSKGHPGTEILRR